MKGKELWRDFAKSQFKPSWLLATLLFTVSAASTVAFGPLPKPLVMWLAVPVTLRLPVPPTPSKLPEDPEVVVPEILRLHFDNAELDVRKDNLGDRGVTLSPERISSLKGILSALSHYAQLGNAEVEVTVHGFASNDSFAIDNTAKSDELNLKAANLRAKAVYDELSELARNKPGLTVHERYLSESHSEMEDRRDTKIPVDSNANRDSFADRVALLELSVKKKVNPENVQ